MSGVDVSVLLCTYNRAGMLGEALDRLTGQETEWRFRYEVVVVDNGSTDGTRQVVEREAAASAVLVRYVFEPAEGVAQARNRAVREAEGRWLAFLDDDELADERWLLELYRAMESTGARVLGGAVRLLLEPEEVARLGVEHRRLLRERGADRFGDRAGPCPPGVNPGTDNLFVESGVVTRAGGFDETMMTGGSDSDLMMRVRAGGVEPWYAPGAVVYHRVPKARLSASGIKHDALQSGAMLAFLANRHQGRGALVAQLLGRLGQAVVVTLPMLLKAKLLADQIELIDRRIKWWRMHGFTRRSLSILAPKLTSGSDFLRSLDFRRARPEGRRPEDVS